MIRRNRVFTIAIVALVVLFTAVDNGLAQGRRGGDHRGGYGMGHQHAPFWSELTETQQAELETLIQSMRDDGASREEIRDAVHNQLEEWGVEFPDHPRLLDHVGDQLTDAQKEELEALIQTLKGQGASHSEIRDAIHAQLEEWEIELPRRGEHRRFRAFGDQLTEAQREELYALSQQMKGDGASRKEVRDAVHTKLAEWGIECPEGHSSRFERKNNHRPQKSGKAMHGGNHPNPFNPETTISYELQQPGNVSVSIFNAHGQLVRSIDAGHQSAGSFQIKWNGKSNAGVAVPSGMYVYKIQAGSEKMIGRMLLMK